MLIDKDKLLQDIRNTSTLSRPVGWPKSYEIVTLDEAVKIVRGGGTQ